MNHSKISCQTIHPLVRETFNGAPEEDTLLDQIAACATTEVINYILGESEIKPGSVETEGWEQIYHLARIAAEVSLYSYKAIAEEPHVTS